jgi:hypothetical protein
MNEPLPDCVIAVHERDGKTYWEVRELPWSNCRMCAAAVRGKSPDIYGPRYELCKSLPACGGVGPNPVGTVFIRPRNLKRYRVAYTIARLGR